MGRLAPWRIVATSPGAEWAIEVATVAAAGGFATFVATPCQTAEAFIAAGATADGISAGNEPSTRRILTGSTRVKVISRPAVGYDRIDVPTATEAGIAITHVPDYCTAEVSDHALALLLALHRRVPWRHAAIMRGGWTQGPAYGAGEPYGVTMTDTARGPIVEEAPLVAALRGGQLAGAALDVTTPEPLPPGSPLLGLPNLLLTPHSAYYSEQARAEVRRRVVEQVLAVLRGEQPPGSANPTVFEQGRLRTLRDH